jgi:hypothetical protein
MKPEVNAVLAEVKQSLAQAHQPAPLMPDFKAMSIMEATKWCIENGITSPKVISETTGKGVNTISTALWKIRNPKRVKVLQRRAKKVRDLKAGIVKEGVKAKPTKIKKPKIENGLYDDGMETPYRDSIMRVGGSFVEPISLEKTRQWIAEKTESTSELLAENRRLKILVEHYETLLFKGGK